MAQKFTAAELIGLKDEWTDIRLQEAIINADIEDLFDDPISVALDVQEKRAKANHKRKMDFVTKVQAGGTGGKG